MPDPLLRITTSRSASETVIKLSGECDIANVDELTTTVDEILRSHPRRIVFDAEDLNFMGSCGLTPMQKAVRVLQPLGGIVVFKRPVRTFAWLLEFFAISKDALIVE